LRFGSLLCAVTVLTDLALTRFVIPDGVYLWKPLPPFSACMTDAQKAWLERQLAEFERGVEEGLTRFDRELGWCPVAGRGTPVGVAPSYHYNSIGARSLREYSPAPPAGVARLACFGDSFTHCEEVSDADAWPAQLEELDPRFEVLNFGVGSYGTDQALLRLRREGLHAAQVACMGFLVENIGRNVNRYRPFYWPPSPSCVAKPRFVLRGEQLELVPVPYATRAELLAAVRDGRVRDDFAEHEHWIAETRWAWAAPSAFVRFAAGWFAYRRREPASLYRDPEGEPYRVTLELLTAFAREARERGAREALVIVFPARRELQSVAGGAAPSWAPLLGDLAERGIAVLDLTPALLEAWSAAPDRAGRDALFSGGHYSRAGNAIIAGTLRDWLAQCWPLE
jgi:hypothetical protein